MQVDNFHVWRGMNGVELSFKNVQDNGEAVSLFLESCLVSAFPTASVATISRKLPESCRTHMLYREEGRRPTIRVFLTLKGVIMLLCRIRHQKAQELFEELLDIAMGTQSIQPIEDSDTYADL